MPVLKAHSPDKTLEASTYLLNSKSDVFSQAGEDGVIQEIFRIIGTNNKWCVEFGAWDGVHLSNTCNLIRNFGWSAVLIEGNASRAAQIEANFPGNRNVTAMCKMVGYDPGENTIDDILAETAIPEDFDFISIDVDGNDWHIWKSIVHYRPRLVVIEFNPSISNHVTFIQDRSMEVSEGSSLAAMIELAREKNYELIAVTNANAFFVVAEEFHRFGITDNSISAMRKDYPNYIFHGYNGKIYHTMGKLVWTGKNVKLEPDSLQVLAVHGRAREAKDQTSQAALGSRDLATADGLLREVVFLRASKPHLPPEEFSLRTRALWIAVKIYMDRHRPWKGRQLPSADQSETTEADGQASEPVG